MHAEELRAQLVRRAAGCAVEARIPPGASAVALEDLEQALGLPLSRLFTFLYREMDGLSWPVPPLELLPLARLSWDERRLIRFCVVGGVHELGLSAGQPNEFGEWSVVNAKTGELLTQSLSHFWTRLLLTWIDQSRPIWEPENPLRPRPEGPATPRR